MPNQPVETNAHTGWPADVIGFMMDSLKHCERRFQRIAHFNRSFGMNSTAATKVRWGLIATGALLALLGLILALILGRSSSGISLELVGYRAKTNGSGMYAELKLRNNSTNVFRYKVVYDEAKFIHERTNGILDPVVRDKITSDFGPLTTSVISQELTSTGWTTVQWEDYVKGVTFTDFPLNAGSAVNLKIPVLPGTEPRKVALLSDDLRKIVNHSAVEMRLRRWLGPVCNAVGIEVTPPNVVLINANRLWCEQIIESPEMEEDSVTE